MSPALWSRSSAVRSSSPSPKGMGEHPRAAFGDPDAYAVQVAEALVPQDRAARARRRDGAMATLDSVLRKTRDATGL